MHTSAPLGTLSSLATAGHLAFKRKNILLSFISLNVSKFPCPFAMMTSALLNASINSLLTNLRGTPTILVPVDITFPSFSNPALFKSSTVASFIIGPSFPAMYTSAFEISLIFSIRIASK
ncbi:119aa long hypothetical protein [Pyrococcus horikoshii OT3]|uniref:Uncharacterized protein n=1 Tax=Pyrococcus horikoshii (strain ATCC 700860 / DSM 12428 / JCM 9974 / NBRC 100139 / OT-3) TaxID=70601 RepID=O59273_PYRHO|nr:119aa long hypothetical protein [Pyrococcus horikoshii OT3]